MSSFPCPKCGRVLQQTGVVTIDDMELPVYQCDECIAPINLGPGETIDGALTFCVGKDGKPFATNLPGGQLP